MSDASNTEPEPTTTSGDVEPPPYGTVFAEVYAAGKVAIRAKREATTLASRDRDAALKANQAEYDDAKGALDTAKQAVNKAFADEEASITLAKTEADKAAKEAFDKTIAEAVKRATGEG